MLAASTTTGASAKHTTLRSLLPAMGRVAQSVHRSKEAALASLAAPGPVNLGDACDSCKVRKNARLLRCQSCAGHLSL
jgi:hypothetical protein